MPPSSSIAASTSSGSNARSVLSRALTPKAEWDDKEDFLDVLYWLRQIVGILLGLGFGLLGLTGSLALAAFAAINAGAGYAYCVAFQGIDEEEYGGIWELTKEGFMTSFAGFLVTWIIIYSGLHFE